MTKTRSDFLPSLGRQGDAFALPDCSPLREALAALPLKARSLPDRQDRVAAYVGVQE